MNDHLSSQDVRRLRLERGWTQHQLAGAASLAAQSTVSDIERGLPFSDATDRRLREVLQPHDESVRTPVKLVSADAA
jgi:transcriptional regulator with XRE-family HTH domain